VADPEAAEVNGNSFSVTHSEQPESLLLKVTINVNNNFMSSFSRLLSNKELSSATELFTVGSFS